MLNSFQECTGNAFQEFKLFKLKPLGLIGRGGRKQNPWRTCLLMHSLPLKLDNHPKFRPTQLIVAIMWLLCRVNAIFIETFTLIQCGSKSMCLCMRAGAYVVNVCL